MLKFYTAVIQPIFYINRLEIIMSDNTDYNNNSEYSTVTLSLDDGSEVECAVIRTFPAGDKNYIALFLSLILMRMRARYIFTDILSVQTMSQFLKILTQMKNTRLFLMPSMKSLMLWNMKNSMSRKTLKINLTYEFVE